MPLQPPAKLTDSHTDPQPAPAALRPVLAELNGAAERIWLTSVAPCPGLSIEVLPHMGSTNTELMARGRRGEIQPTVLAAAFQTAGRGRLGRSWQAAPGHTLTFSLGLPLNLTRIPGGASALSLAVGLAQIGAQEPTKRLITGLVIVAAVIFDLYRERLGRRAA